MTTEELIDYAKTKKNIIFDFDGTICTLLIDWQPWKKELQDLYLSLDGKFVEHGVSKAQNDYVLRFGDEVRSKILEINLRHEQKYLRGYERNEKIISAIPELAKFAKLYIWTSNDIKTILPIVKELGFEKLFSKIVAKNDVKLIKPGADGFYLICDRNNPVSEYMLIGDSEADSGAAEKAGIEFVNISSIN